MDMRQLAAVVAVADLGTVSRAASTLGLAQPSVTRQIKLLEGELGVALFDRTHRGMTLTLSGEILVDHARRAMLELDRAQAEIRPERAAISGVVNVGLLESIAELVAGPLVEAVAARHPGIELRLLTAYSGHLQQWLEDGELDLTFLYDRAPSPTVQVVPVVQEELWAVAPPGSGLAPDTPITVAELIAHPLVLPTQGHGLRALLDEAILPTAHVRPVAQVNSMALQKALVVGGHGWSVLPASGVAALVSAGQLTAAPIGSPAVVRQVGLGLRPRSRTPRALSIVLRELGHIVRALVGAQAWAGARLDSTDDRQG